jgi:two-component sensor histidine kinase
MLPALETNDRLVINPPPKFSIVILPDAAITVETPEELFAMSTERLEDAVYELGTNAAKHGGEQPTVELGVEPRPEEGTLSLPVTDNSDATAVVHTD